MVKVGLTLEVRGDESDDDAPLTEALAHEVYVMTTQEHDRVVDSISTQRCL